jgi:hypothetical protein
MIDDGDSQIASSVISCYSITPYPTIHHIHFYYKYHTLPAHNIHNPRTTTSLAANHVEKKCPLSTCRRRRQDVAIIVEYERMFVPNTINPMS